MYGNRLAGAKTEKNMGWDTLKKLRVSQASDTPNARKS